MERSEQDRPVRIELTEEQRKKFQLLTGREVAALEFTVQELEERITPGLSTVN